MQSHRDDSPGCGTRISGATSANCTSVGSVEAVDGGRPRRAFNLWCALSQGCSASTPGQYFTGLGAEAGACSTNAGCINSLAPGAGLGVAAYQNAIRAGETIVVGRWMSAAEYRVMRETGRVQESFSGTTHVTMPASASAFSAAGPGSVYVEFEVSRAAVRATSSGQAQIIGPNSSYGRLLASRGTPVARMPEARNIRVVRSN